MTRGGVRRSANRDLGWGHHGVSVGRHTLGHNRNQQPAEPEYFAAVVSRCVRNELIGREQCVARGNLVRMDREDGAVSRARFVVDPRRNSLEVRLAGGRVAKVREFAPGDAAKRRRARCRRTLNAVRVQPRTLAASSTPSPSHSASRSTSWSCGDNASRTARTRSCSVMRPAWSSTTGTPVARALSSSRVRRSCPRSSLAITRRAVA